MNIEKFDSHVSDIIKEIEDDFYYELSFAKQDLQSDEIPYEWVKGIFAKSLKAGNSFRKGILTEMNRSEQDDIS